jgi:non-specific serine/threonine protein kinase
LLLAQQTGDEPFTADALARLGAVALREGSYQQSAAFYQRSLALNRFLGNRDGIAEDLAGLAEVACLAGQPERAARLLGTVEAVREAHGIELSPLRRSEHDRIMRSIRTQLGEVAFAEAWTWGCTMRLEQAIEEALETNGKPPSGPSSSLHPELPPALSPRRMLQQRFGGLTAREREVARLVAQGRSNRAIAEELVVGVSTVEAHIAHIFTKLGFSSRAQIASWAVHMGLVQVSQDVEVTSQED